MMKILGIDPGIRIMGYGIINADDDNVTLIDFGTLIPDSNQNNAKRLNDLYQGLIKIISNYRPDVVAVEQPFISKNVRSAMSIGQAQAIALLAAATKHIPSYEYTPTQIKQRVANYGAGSKEQIQEMVRMQLGLNEIPEPNDAADALAVAICHIREIHLNNIIANHLRVK
jgi:crossover junction endodeoxyribonuclease RuvC